MNPLVSVIIPVYNVEKYLEQCVQSVLDQKYDNLEIILVDDGSTDGSGKICDSFSDERIKVFHKENGGLSSARNFGLDRASGEYVYFLDSDDYVLEDTIACCVDKLVEVGSDFVFFNADSFRDSGEAIAQNYYRKGNYPVGSGKAVFSAMQSNGEFHSAVPLMFFRNSFLENNQLSFKEGIFFEDMLFTFQAYCLADSVAYLPKSLYQRRYRDGSIMTSSVSVKKFESLCIVVKELVRFCEGGVLFDEEFVKRYIARNSFNALNMYSSLTRNDQEKCKSFFDDLKALLKANVFFGDAALKARTHGKAAWAAVKLLQKVRGY